MRPSYVASGSDLQCSTALYRTSEVSCKGNEGVEVVPGEVSTMSHGAATGSRVTVIIEIA